MPLTVKYFGMLTDITQCSEEMIDSTATTVVELLHALYLKYPALKDMDFQVAQNHKLVNKESALAAEELALLPPFAGG